MNITELLADQAIRDGYPTTKKVTVKGQVYVELELEVSAEMGDLEVRERFEEDTTFVVRHLFERLTPGFVAVKTYALVTKAPTFEGNPR